MRNRQAHSDMDIGRELDGEWRPVLTFSISVVAEKDGVLQTAYDSVSASLGYEFLDKVDVVRLSKKVAERRGATRGARRPLGEMPVIIAAQAGGRSSTKPSVIRFEADAVQKGVSPMYQGAIGKVVGHEKVSVLEDPRWAVSEAFMHSMMKERLPSAQFSSITGFQDVHLR